MEGRSDLSHRQYARAVEEFTVEGRQSHFLDQLRHHRAFQRFLLAHGA